MLTTNIHFTHEFPILINSNRRFKPSPDRFLVLRRIQRNFFEIPKPKHPAPLSALLCFEVKNPGIRTIYNHSLSTKEKHVREKTMPDCCFTRAQGTEQHCARRVKATKLHLNAGRDWSEGGNAAVGITASLKGFTQTREMSGLFDASWKPW